MLLCIFVTILFKGPGRHLLSFLMKRLSVIRGFSAFLFCQKVFFSFHTGCWIIYVILHNYHKTSCCDLWFHIYFVIVSIFISIFEIWLQSSRLIFSCLLPNSMHLLMCCSPDHCSLTGGESLSLKHLYWAINAILTVHEDNVWMNSFLCALQEEEVVQEEELQEEDQEVIETWTRNVKACTCDCESAESPTSTLAVEPSVPPTSLPSSFQGQPLNCMPGEESDCTTVTWPELTCSPLSHSRGRWMSFKFLK